MVAARLLIAAWTLLGACVVNPIDGDRINDSDRSTVRNFTGYILEGGKPVRAYAYSTSATGSAWALIGATTSMMTVASSVSPFFGMDLFKWNLGLSGPIDEAFWRPGVTGRRLRLQFRTDITVGANIYEWPLMSLNGDSAFPQSNDLQQFMANYQGARSTDVVLTTTDFACHDYGGTSNGTNLDFCCDDMPQRTRLEGTGPSARCQGKDTSFVLPSGHIPGETTAAFVGGWKDSKETWHRPRLVVGYNENMEGNFARPCKTYEEFRNPSTPEPLATEQITVCNEADLMGWSTSTDGISWTLHNSLDNSSGPPLATPDASATTDDLKQQNTQVTFTGDPTVIARNSGVVVYVSMGKSFYNWSRPPRRGINDMVLASISLDGGETFPRTVRVNGIVDGMTAFVDQPDAVFNPDDLSLWVTWRATGGTSSQNTVFVRGGTVGDDGTISWFDGGHIVASAGPFYGPRVVVTGVGAAREVAVSYLATIGHEGECALASANDDAVQVFLSTSTDLMNWVESTVGLPSRTFPLTSYAFHMPRCVGGGSMGLPSGLGLVKNSLRATVVLDRRDPMNTAYVVAISESRFVTNMDGTYSTRGSRIIVARHRRSDTPESFWEDISPIDNDSWRFFPELAVRQDGLALAYYETSTSVEAPPHQRAGMRIVGRRGIPSTETWSFPTTLSASMGDTELNTSLGSVSSLTFTARGNDYIAIVPIPADRGAVAIPANRQRFEGFPGDFYVAWSASRLRHHVAGYGVPQ